MKIAAHNYFHRRKSRAFRVAVATKKIRRRRDADELAVEQTRDLPAVASMLAAAGRFAEGVEAPGGCYLLASVGPAVAGVIGIEARVDAALVRSLFVTAPMRRRGIGAALVTAARTAAHTRGARTLYALAADVQVAAYLERLGFASSAMDALLVALAGTFVVEYLRKRPGDLARYRALALDIAQDGVIMR
jgi:N-acetylglutamate synthase-like GNAT family acetyltransferase